MDPIVGIIVTSIATVLTAAIAGYLALLMARLNINAAAAAKAAEVAAEVAKSAATLQARTAIAHTTALQGIADVGNVTHSLVNSQMEIQLELYASVTDQLANKTNTEADRRQADMASKALRDHRSKDLTARTAAANAALVSATRDNTAALRANTQATGTDNTGNTGATIAATDVITTAVTEATRKP